MPGVLKASRGLCQMSNQVPETTPKTPRLTELEMKTQWGTATADAKIEGYRMAQTDYAKVIKAAQQCVDYFKTLDFIPDCGFAIEVALGELESGIIE